MSTGTKMLFILTAALLPLGLIALLVSIQSDRSKREQRQNNAQVVATAEARQIDILTLRGTNMLRAALASPGLDGSRCTRLLTRNARGFPVPIRLAIVEPDGQVRCATPGFRPALPTGYRPGNGTSVRLMTGADRMRFVTDGDGGTVGIGELPLPLLQAVMMPAGDGSQSIFLFQPGVRFPLVQPTHRSPLGHSQTVTAAVAGGQVTLSLTQIINPISAVEVLLVLLPILMWAAAAAIGWLVVDHLLLKPLGQLQRAVTAHGSGKGAFEVPALTTPAQEIRELADAFHDASVQITRREDALGEGLERQMKLTREVHHRVKNNLQVVASLINLHSRGTEGDVAAAYASIQRRVDALAVVHRNHYAELEQNRGVALRSIVAELTSNLRATAPPAAAHLSIALDMMSAFVSQDVAVPVAFLVTEIVELAMTCDPTGSVSVALLPGPEADRALLVVGASGLARQNCLDHPSRDRFQRIVTGLSRQLRATLDYEETSGTHRIAIQIVPQEAEAAS
jgi:two-component sensor histidine kinase